MSGLKRFSPLRRQDLRPVLLQMDSCLTVQNHKHNTFEFQQGIQDKVFHYQLTPGAANKKDMALFEDPRTFRLYCIPEETEEENSLKGK